MVQLLIADESVGSILRNSDFYISLTNFKKKQVVMLLE